MSVSTEVDDGFALAGVGQNESPGQSQPKSGIRFGRRLVVIVLVEAPDGDRNNNLAGLGAIDWGSAVAAVNVWGWSGDR